MKKTKKILIFILIWILLSGIIKQYIYNIELIIFVPDLLLLYLALTKFPKKSRLLGTYIGKYIPMLFSILIVGGSLVSILNFMPLISLLWGLRMVVRYLLLFIFIYRTFDMSDVYKFKNIVTKAFWVNLLFVAFQFFVEGKIGDWIGGTFSDNGMQFLFNLFCVFIFSADYFSGRLKRRRFVMILASQMFIAMVAEIKMMYFTIPLAVYAVYVMLKKFSFKHIAVLVVAFVGLVPAMSSVMSLMYGEEYIEKVFDLESIQDETSHAYSFSAENDIGFNRNTSAELAGSVILQDWIHHITGYGVGSANASPLFGTWIFARYGVLTSYNYFTSSYLLIEYGWIGFIIWIIILALIAKRFYNMYIKSKDPYIKYWSSIGCVSALFTYLIAWYNNTPYCNAYIIYYFWGICWIAIRERAQAELRS